MTEAEIEQAVSAAGLGPLTPGAVPRLHAYLQLLLKWNARLNLTAIRNPHAIVERHFIECLFAAQHLPAGIRKLLDFGSGGGFPGIPIALQRPEIQVTLGESQGKKAAFLREAIRTLGLQNAAVYNGRLEEFEMQFDAVALRAVDKMQEACQVALRHVVPGGSLVLFVTDKTGVPELADVAWQPAILLPGSQHSYLVIGNVPRGTHPQA